VATVMTKAALLLQLLISSSCEMIFLTRATGVGLDGVASLPGYSSKTDRVGEQDSTYAAGRQCHSPPWREQSGCCCTAWR